MRAVIALSAAAGVLLALTLPLSFTPLAALYPARLTAFNEQALVELPAAETTTLTGWLIVAAGVVICIGLVARGVHHLRT